MIKTLGGKFVKAVAVALAAVCMLGCALMFTGCESRYPEITMRISFNGESYELRYKLSRDLYSQTVAHYLELIDLGYFDGTVIHDYQSDRLIGGGYTYADMENGDAVEDLTACDYDAATTDAEGNVTLENVTVWADADRTQATNRLHGETSANGFSIESGNGLRNRFGTLGAYTYVGTGEKNIVYYAKSSDNGYGSSEYYKNSFTSMFYIYTSTTSSTERNYCVFAELADDASEDALNELLDAIDAYTEDLESGSFTESKEVTIQDEFTVDGSYEATFAVPTEKIVIEEVTVDTY